MKSRVQLLLELSDQFFTLFNDIKVEPRFFKSKEDCFAAIEEFTRPKKSSYAKLNYDSKSDQSLRAQLFTGARCQTMKDYFVLDDYFHRVYTMENAPKRTIFGKDIDVLESVECEFIYAITFKKIPFEEANKTFKGKIMEKKIMSGNDTSAVKDKVVEKQTQKVDEAYEMFADGESEAVLGSTTFVFRTKMDYLERLAANQNISVQEIVDNFDHTLRKKVFPAYGLSNWILEPNTQWIVFNQLIPGNSNFRNIYLKKMLFTTRDVPYLFPMWDGKQFIDHNGTNHFVDERSNLFTFELMDPRLDAWNYSISGQTGSGKSVLVNTILTQQLADVAKTGKKPIICILDVGGDRGSYTKIMELTKGSAINLSGAKKPHIQMMELAAERAMPTLESMERIANIIRKQYPNESHLEVKLMTMFMEYLKEGRNKFTKKEEEELFDRIFEQKLTDEIYAATILKPGEVEPSKSQMNIILALLDVILGGSAGPGMVGSFDGDLISELVLKTYRVTKGRFPYLSDLAKVVDDSLKDEGDKGKLLTKLKNWTRKGSYTMFDMDTDVDMNNDVTLVDLKGLEADKQLQAMYTLLFSQMFNNKMYFVRGRRKLIVRDEAWSLMTNQAARKFFVEDLRTARKSGFATLAISQLPIDYLNPDPNDGRAIIDNMQVQVLCKFDKESTSERIGKELALSEETVKRMKTLGVVRRLQPDGSYKALYATFMIVKGRQVYVLRNMLHPFEYQLYSSSEEDNAVIDYYRKVSKQITDLEACLRFISEDKHVGDQALADYLENAGQKNAAKRVRGGDKK